jgi:DNA topoisomerase I
MAKNLVIVESPAKAKTIEKYLGADFEVMASFGHVRDLRPEEGSVEPDNGFFMHYDLIDKNKKHMANIVKAMKTADALYLAPDPDREGEAIAWHIQQVLQDKKALKSKPIHRVTFHEITKSAVKAAVENPHLINMDLVNAQQARRALDYLVGFNLSPLLWKKIRRGLSAGRVQSPALRLIVEREIAIEAFNSKEYWSIDAACNIKQQDFSAKLMEYNGVKVEQFTFTAAEQTEKVKEDLLKTANGKLLVSKVVKKAKKRNPSPPFTTSTLQQEASRKLGFSAKRTMITAQKLYEEGLITYMRTDSVTLAGEALTEIRDLIVEKYGKENLPDDPRFYKTKSKNAQEAHEAIRPTSAFKTPDSVGHLPTVDQLKLYTLIWKRTIACQMIHATMDTVAIDLTCGENRFRASGSVIANPGFITVYQEGIDDSKKKDGDDKILPAMEEGDKVDLKDILCDQHFTEPPPRFSEATLVKALEEFGIGRPSTYAAIISTLQNREYVILESKRFKPTDIGRIVNRFLTKYFTRYVDFDFTAHLEDQLDEISRGEKAWVPVMEDFWYPFIDKIKEINTSVQRKDVTQEEIDELCPKCGKKLSIRLGRNGRFIGCPGYPDCDYTRNLDDDPKEEPKIVEGRSCPKCGSQLIIKKGRYGQFIGCSAYPECKFIESLNKPVDTGVICPECHKGTMLKRKSKKGKVFYSCSEYPKCKYAVWDEPITERCPNCGWPILTIKTTKSKGKQKVCPQKNCGYREDFS